MITIIPAADRHFTDMGWLQTYWLFSFSDYFDPENVNHGRLRVCNDDIVQPATGFGEHSHNKVSGRHLFLYMIEGQATVDGQGIGRGDQVRIRNRQRLEITAADTADFILVDIGGR